MASLQRQRQQQQQLKWQQTDTRRGHQKKNQWKALNASFTIFYFDCRQRLANWKRKFSFVPSTDGMIEISSCVVVVVVHGAHSWYTPHIQIDEFNDSMFAFVLLYLQKSQPAGKNGGHTMVYLVSIEGHLLNCRVVPCVCVHALLRKCCGSQKQLAPIMGSCIYLYFWEFRFTCRINGFQIIFFFSRRFVCHIRLN